MNYLLAVLLLWPILAFARVGPDLSAGTGVEYFTQLRLDYSKNPKTEFYPVWRVAPEHGDLVKAYRAGETDRVIEIADSWLKKCPIDADTHLRVAMCFKEKGNLPSYTYHLSIFYGLLRSIAASGDGLTPETAFKVVSIHEEYSLIQEIGANLEKQSLVTGPCDKMEISRKNGKVKMTLYFNVSIPMAFTESKLKSGK
ncbi:MAG: DUF4919 domain-containing protein [Verrucomicrobia bacterium]|nr:DUF4919 domain-containing protein [Verrucomicrobiota bacterium]